VQKIEETAYSVAKSKSIYLYTTLKFLALQEALYIYIYIYIYIYVYIYIYYISKQRINTLEEIRSIQSEVQR
jgi:hypothetical protein